MTVYVFLGPTLRPDDARPELDAVYLPPVAQGDVYRLTLKDPTAIGIVDGRFQDVPAVWHKEILWALSRGVPVYGSASMGALRAAELADFGMRGVGWVFKAYQGGLLEDDDEVAVAHGDVADGFVATSEALVNIRRTLVAAVTATVLGAGTASRLADLVKEVFYPSRTYRGMLDRGYRAGLPPGELDAFAAWLPAHRVDQKRSDAIEMLRTMREDVGSGVPSPASFTFEHTQYFERLRRSAGEMVLTTTDDQGDVTLEDLLDELRLDPTAYTRVYERSVMRCIAVRDALRNGTDEGRLRAVADRFRRARELYGPADTLRWLTANHLTTGQFAALIREEEAIGRVSAEVHDHLDIFMRSQLRVDGLYPRLADRVRAKRRALAEAGLDDPAVVYHDNEDNEDLLRWYFARRAAAVPSELGDHWQAMGFPDENAFLRAVGREYWFLSVCQHESEALPETPTNG